MPKIDQYRETESRLWLLGTWRRGEWGVTVNAYGFLFGVIKMFGNLIVVIAQLCEYAENH